MEMEVAKLRSENAELQDNNISLLSDLEERQHLLEEGKCSKYSWLSEQFYLFVIPCEPEQ